jgi:hypothetical protein
MAPVSGDRLILMYLQTIMTCGFLIRSAAAAVARTVADRTAALDGSGVMQARPKPPRRQRFQGGLRRARYDFDFAIARMPVPARRPVALGPESWPSLPSAAPCSHDGHGAQRPFVVQPLDTQRSLP